MPTRSSAPQPARAASLRPAAALLRLLAAVTLMLAHPHQALLAQTAPTPNPWRYTLVHGSTLLDDCPVCDRPALILPLRGTFELRQTSENPLFTFYTLENIDFEAGSEGGPRYRVTGRGEYQVGGEVALVHQLSLQLLVDDGLSPRQASCSSGLAPVDRAWPMLRLPVKQTDGTEFHQLSLELSAAPFRDLWFSTNHGMTSGTTPPPFVSLPNSTLLSHLGHPVKTNAQLTRNLGLMPIVPDIGLEAVDVLPGGEIAFSPTRDIFSESLGPLQRGDVLSDRGRILHTQASLLSPFQPMPPMPPLGLDAVHVTGPGEVCFSLDTGFFSEKLGRSISPGDLLTNQGTVLKSQAELLSKFQIVTGDETTQANPGLDAVYLWPTGEIWFSTTHPFQDKSLGLILAGDLLSDQGYVVFRNLELVAAFSPLEDLADFGLDAFTLVTDATPVPASPPIVTAITLQAPETSLRLEWQGQGRFFQVLGAPSPAGPYFPLTPILPDQSFTTRQPAHHPEFYFRVRHW